MLRILSYSLMVLLVLSWTAADGNAQPSERVRQDTDIPSRVERKLRRDAARLTLRMQADREDLRYQGIVIPRDVMDEVYLVLSTVYTQNEAARAVANCNVHTFPNPSIDHFVLIYDKEIEWAAPLRDGISETTSFEINDLLDQYDLVIEKHVQWDDLHDALTIRSREPLNMAALAHQFQNVEGVSDIELGQPRLRGNDIQMERIPTGWKLTYILRFGAPVGKGKEHRWIFECRDDGQSVFLKEEGDEIPTYMRCDLETESRFVSRG